MSAEAVRLPSSLAIGELTPEIQWHSMLRRATYGRIPLATFSDMNFGTWDSKRTGTGIRLATEYAMAMAQGKTEFTLLTIAGPRGVGKTHLVIALSWDAIIRGFYVEYRQAATLLEELRQCYSLTPKQIERRELSFTEVMESFLNCDILVIDDLGAQKETDWAAEKMDHIIDHRWLNRLPLVVTTNALSEDLPPRIADRLGDIHRGKVVQIVAKSYRRE